MVLPEELHALVAEKLSEKVFSYARVFMSLFDVVSGDFFNQYIKTGMATADFLSHLTVIDTAQVIS